jgi:hypothetical protein
VVLATVSLIRKQRCSAFLFTRREGGARRLDIGLIPPRLTELIAARESAA